MTEKITEKMIRYFGTDVCRINHALKVFALAGCIARRENLSGNEIRIVDLAALLHDIGIREAEIKYNSTAGKYQEMEGPAVARNILSDEKLDCAALDRICHIIGNHHSYSKIDGMDFQIVVEADFLVNIFEDEMPPHSIASVREKYFKTKTGISMLESMYIRS